MSDGEIALADMIDTLRSELAEAQRRGAASAISFGIEKVELELKVTVSRSAQGQAGIKFWVVNAGAKVDTSNQAVHTFTLTLSALDAKTSDRVKVASTAQSPINKDK